MKITLVSDLHLEFGYQELPGGEVLILAGDIAEEKNITKHFHSTKLVQDGPSLDHQCSEFFKFECSKYERVFYVMGNHEHYHGRFDRTYHALKTILPDNVTVLEQEAVEYRGVVFVGATMWTDLNKGNPITMNIARGMMNDYHTIKMHDLERNAYYRLTPNKTVQEHKKTLKFFQTTVSHYKDKPIVVITHHAPSRRSISSYYKNDIEGNYSYATELDEFIMDNPQIRVWCHGHMHHPNDYMIGNTRVLSNPRGYIHYQENDDFNPGLTFEVNAL